MSSDCEVYVDPEEDEVFFGCISDREKSICARLSQQSVLGKDLNSSFNSDLSCESKKEKGDGDANENEHVDSNNYNGKKSADESELSFKDANTTIIKTPDNSQSSLNKTAVESEHNYSTPMKHKIDKTILTTPKSVVKADRDGGFLKVLSEIAIVKAEAEGDKKIEEEDKENKIIPDIIITEATPDKAQFVSPPRSNNSHSRRFRIIYNSPKNEENVDNKNTNRKSAKDNFENCQNIINKSLDGCGKDNIILKEKRKSTELCNESINLIDLNNSNFSKKNENVDKTTAVKVNNSPVQKCEPVEETKKMDDSDLDVIFIEEKNADKNKIVEVEEVEKKPEEICINDIDSKKEIISLSVEPKEEDKKVKNICIETKNEMVPVVEESESINTGEVLETLSLGNVEADLKEEKSDSVSENVEVVKVEESCRPIDENVEEKGIILTQKENIDVLIVEEEEKSKPVPSEDFQKTEEPLLKSEPPPEHSFPKVPEGIRFSKEARKIVELLKKSAVDDTINTTIDEVDESSFLSPENISLFETTSTVTTFPEPKQSSKKAEIVENIFVKHILDTIVEKVVSEPLETKTPRKDFLKESVKTPKLTSNPAEIKSNALEKSCGNKVIKPSQNVQKFSPKIKPPMIKLTHQPYTVEKDRIKFTPMRSQTKIASVKYFSDRKVNDQNPKELKKCVKKLPMEDKEDKPKGIKDTNTICSSKIPVFGLKTSKIAVPTRNTPMKTPSKNYKNPKYKNIESPINAYINNKTTALVQNVKPEVKKEGISKLLKPQTIAKNHQEKPTANIKFPFVEYRSATPYKVEKRPESRLPRLAPTVQKLIGSNSPTVLKHEGRFYVKNAVKPVTTNDSTVLGDPNEVSLLVGQAAQKTNSMK